MGSPRFESINYTYQSKEKKMIPLLIQFLKEKPFFSFRKKHYKTNALQNKKNVFEYKHPKDSLHISVNLKN